MEQSETRGVDKDRWSEVMGQFVVQLAVLTRNIYFELFADRMEEDKFIDAEPLCSMLSDGVLALLAMLNETNEADNESGFTTVKFDVIPLFLQELLMRTSSLGYTVGIDGQLDPKAYKQAMDALEEIMKPPEGEPRQ